MSKNARILICDDDAIVHQSLSLYLDNEDLDYVIKTMNEFAAKKAKKAA